jgi:hypothetical protein
MQKVHMRYTFLNIQGLNVDKEPVSPLCLERFLFSLEEEIGQ